MQTNTITKHPAAVHMQFLFLDLKEKFATIRDEVMAAVNRFMESQQFIMGPEVSALEEEIKAQVGCQYVFGCESGDRRVRSRHGSGGIPGLVRHLDRDWKVSASEFARSGTFFFGRRAHLTILHCSIRRLDRLGSRA